jgi:hypothetical protein
MFRGRCVEMNAVSELFASNGCFSGSAILALSKYATVILNISCRTMAYTAYGHNSVDSLWLKFGHSL